MRSCSARLSAGGRAYWRNSVMMLSSRVASRIAMSINRQLVSSSTASFRSICIAPAKALSGFRISWAIPADISPKLASQSLRRISSSRSRISVRSLNTPTRPVCFPCSCNGERVIPRIRRLPSARLHSTSNRVVVDTAPLGCSSDSWLGCQLNTSRQGRPAT